MEEMIWKKKLEGKSKKKVKPDEDTESNVSQLEDHVVDPE